MLSRPQNVLFSYSTLSSAYPAKAISAAIFGAAVSLLEQSMS
jgi:hypothetical protein